MEKLTDLPNIGKDTARLLTEAGIDTPEKLRAMGAKDAFIHLRLRDPSVCINRLCGLQGAIEGIRWHGLSAETKADLNAFFKELK